MGCNTPSMLPEPERLGQRKVFCVKFQREMPGLDEPPFDTELGQRIYESVSEEAWKMWGEHCKMLLNEYRLNPANRQDAGDPRQAPGRFLLWRGRRASTGIRPPAQQGLISGFYMPDLKVLLISTYELGRQPFGLASPAAWLRAAGFHTTSLHASRDSRWTKRQYAPPA